MSRSSAIWLAWYMCVLSLALTALSLFLLVGVVHLSSAYAVYALLAEPGSLPGGELAAWMRSWDWVPYLGLFVFLFLLFPDGRTQSNRWRWFAWLVGVVVVVGTFMAAYSP